MLQNMRLGFKTKYTIAVAAIICLSFAIWGTKYMPQTVVLTLGFPMLLYVQKKLIKYELVNEHIKVVAFGFLILANLAIKDIIRVDETGPFSFFYFLKKGIFRFSRFGNSLNSAKILTMRDGRIVSITPEHGSKIEIMLSSIGRH